MGIYNEHYDVGWPRHLLSPQITLFNDNFIQNKFRGTDKAKTSEFLTHLFYSHPSTYQNGLVQTKGYPFFYCNDIFFSDGENHCEAWELGCLGCPVDKPIPIYFHIFPIVG